MRFDDTLGTVLALDLSSPMAAQAAWRQIVDLTGRGRAPIDAQAAETLEALRTRVPVNVRAASARGLFGASPPLALTRILASDDIAVAAPVLRGAEMAADDWIALLPELSPNARAVLRHRRDLPDAVVRGLASFGAVDFVLDDQTVPAEVASPEPALVPAVTPELEAALAIAPVPADPGPFVSVGSVALGLPVVAEALRRENDNEAPPSDENTFRIADVVARLEAFQRRREGVKTSSVPPAAAAAPTGFRFETDPSGTLRWVDGVARGALIGLGIAHLARPHCAGVDGVASGAFRQRARFTDAHLLVDGDGEVAGRWLISGVPTFDPASGRFTGYRGSGRRPRRQERVEGAPALDPASDSLRQLVHELRTPTNAIAGFSEMIEHQMLGPVGEPYREQATTMRRDAGGLLAAIDDLDAAARIAAGALPLRAESVALAPLVERLAAEFAPLARSRGALFDLGDVSGVAVADSRALERLIARVLGAMIGAAGAGEAVTVRTFDIGARLGLTITRPAALDPHPGEAVLDIDDEDSPASLLGVGFALRLARNLAREIGGRLTIGYRHITLYLPAAIDGLADQAGMP